MRYLDYARQYSDERPWESRPEWGSSIEGMYPLDDIYYRMRRADFTPEELEEIKAQMAAIRQESRDVYGAHEWVPDEQGNGYHRNRYERDPKMRGEFDRVSRRIVDLYGDYSDRFLTRSPVPEGLSRAEQVNHVLLATKGKTINHAIPKYGEHGTIAQFWPDHAVRSKFQDRIFDDGSVLIVPGNTYAYAPGSPGARKNIKLAINAFRDGDPGFENTYHAKNEVDIDHLRDLPGAHPGRFSLANSMLDLYGTTDTPALPAGVGGSKKNKQRDLAYRGGQPPRSAGQRRGGRGRVGY